MISIPVPIPFGFFCGCIPFRAREDAERDASCLDQLLLWPVDQLPRFQGRHNAPGPIGGGGESHARVVQLFAKMVPWVHTFLTGFRTLVPRKAKLLSYLSRWTL
jgi:hypothetical protein